MKVTYSGTASYTGTVPAGLKVQFSTDGTTWSDNNIKVWYGTHFIARFAGADASHVPATPDELTFNSWISTNP